MRGGPPAAATVISSNPVGRYRSGISTSSKRVLSGLERHCGAERKSAAVTSQEAYGKAGLMLCRSLLDLLVDEGVIAREKALDVIDEVAALAGEKAKTVRGKLPDKGHTRRLCERCSRQPTSNSFCVRCRRDLESSLEALQGPVIDGGAGAEGADTGRGEIENVDDHNRPHDAEERYHYMHLPA